ncbi:AAA family ATPase [Stutzerimonas azotifigens]|uniref:AAA family ATPase n=1 Tax=Stutzerimonas azotifigens TaxID=291995 RepID=UPI00041D5CD9|nr:AAA family ATPase [Stutzerimonas azotifigens]
MKILAIRLKNLASLAGEQAIDFTAEPLASAGLFAITGPTGAGKSTLLDALCLALFGSTPRLGGASALSKVPDGADELGSSDERNLLRRGCASGYAEVDFVGVDGLVYRARWDARRAKEKVGGRLQQSTQSLVELGSGQVLASGKKREFRELLEQRLGLSLPQFTRAVLLAQSEFSAFLKASDDDRGTLLEKLTDTGLYSRIGQASFEAMKTAREAVTALEQQAGGLQPLSDEQRQALQQQHDEQLAQLRALQGQLEQLKQQRQWLAERDRLQTERDAAQQQLAEARAEYEQLADARRILELFGQLAPQRHRFARQQALAPQLATVAQTLARQQAEHDRLKERLAQLQAACEAATSELEQAEKAQREATPALARARKEEEALAHVAADLEKAGQEARLATAAHHTGETQVAALKEQQARAAEQLTALTAALEASADLHWLCSSWSGYRPRLQQAVQLAARLGQGQRELPALEQAANRAEAAQQKAREALDGLLRELGSDTGLAEQLARLARQLDDWHAAERGLEILETRWSRQQALIAQRHALDSTLAARQQALEALTAEGKQVRSERDVAEQALNVTLALLERQRLARSASVETLRASLRPDEPCPVCGSAEHPWHTPNALLAALGQQDEAEAERARAQLKAADERLQALRDRHTELNTELKENARTRQALAQEIEALQAQLAELPDHAELEAQPADARADWLNERLADVRQRIAEAGTRQQHLLGLQQRTERLQRDWQSAREACVEATARRDRQREALARDGQRLEEELAEFAESMPAGLLACWREAPAETFMQLDARIQARREQLDRQIELVDEQQRRQAALEREQAEQQHRLAAEQACKQRLADLEQRRQSGQQALRSALGEQPSAAAWQTQLDQAVQAARVAQAQIDREQQEAKVALTRLESDHQACARRHEELQSERAQLDAELADWRAAHPDIDDATLGQLLQLDDSLLAEARERLQANAEAITRCRARLEERSQRLAGHQAQQQAPLDAEALERQFAEQSRGCEEAEQRCGETRAALIEDDRRRAQGRELVARIAEAQAEHQRWARIAGLIGSSDGGAFRKIAQAYNLDLLVQHANAQLQQLARRYRLRRGGSPLGLLVVDTEMGDELRSVHSLSGGETFLVSLALALGLASMASSKLRIESLFIDEGFGSLDPESLQIAMDALDALQAQGRKVAVISHVQEMHERIPVQIQVRRLGNGQSGLKIVGGLGG